MWNYQDLATTIARGLQHEEHKLKEEQAVRGLDALHEVELHPLIDRALAASGLGVWRERPYPSQLRVGERRAQRRDRERCDLVLSHGPRLEPVEPLDALREQDELAGTLFEHVLKGESSDSAAKRPRKHSPARATAAANDLHNGPATTPETQHIPVEDCCWLEIKTLGQFAFASGVPGPCRGYGSQLCASVLHDIRKLNAEPNVRWGGLVLIFFCTDRDVARHDLAVACNRAIDKGVEMRPPASEGFTIVDRIGNAWCEVAMLGV